MTRENPPFEDVFPIENGDSPMSWGVSVDFFSSPFKFSGTISIPNPPTQNESGLEQLFNPYLDVPLEVRING